jgi:hypothetical protein
MPEPLTATAIAAYAFASHFVQTELGKKFIESMVGEAGKRVLATGLDKMGELKEKIVQKLSGNSSAEVAIASAEEGDSEALADVAYHLRDAMKTDSTFATELQQMAEQIINIDTIEGKNVQNAYGRQIIMVNDAQDKVINAGDHNVFNFGVSND